MKKHLPRPHKSFFASQSHYLYYGIFFIVLAFLVMAYATDSDSQSYTEVSETNPVAVVVTEVDVNLDGTLTIHGHNFDAGLANVFLDGSPLNVTDQTANEIIADLPGAADLTGNFLLTVETGVGLDHFDVYGLILGDADPEAPENQLLIRDSDIFIHEHEEHTSLVIPGHNLKKGDLLPEVTLGGTTLEVDEEESDEDLIVAYTDKEAFASSKANLLTVKTGEAVENYDVVLPTFGATFAGPEEWCDPSGLFCWKVEKLTKTKWYCFGGMVPEYYELTRDYEFRLADIYRDHKDKPLPEWAADMGRSVEDYLGLMEALENVPFEKRTDNYKWDFVSLVKEELDPEYALVPTLKIRKGYRWDGTTRPCRRLEEETRAGLIHDAMYDLIRFKLIPWDGDQSIGAERDELNNRELADMLFYWVNVEDREYFKEIYGIKPKGDPDSTTKTLHKWGKGRAGYHIERDANWRFHTLADAWVSSENEKRVKTLMESCALPSTQIEFDASESRPIAEAPKIASSKHSIRFNLHETTWQWNLNGIELVPEQQNYIGKTLDWNTLTAAMTVDQLRAKGLKLGTSEVVTLYIDKGKGEEYEKEDKVVVNVEFDTEPPVITGISEPIIMWPPDHKYKSFTIGDFVSSVSDNCTPLTLDDLVITVVTSDEPEDAKGSGHTENDIVLSPDGKSVDLRIERQGKGDGRAYTIYIRAVDESGNATTESFQVQVPHNRQHSDRILPDPGS